MLLKSNAKMHLHIPRSTLRCFVVIIVFSVTNTAITEFYQLLNKITDYQ